MSNIYLKVTIEKNWRSQNFGFLSSKKFVFSSVSGSSNSHKYYWILKFNVAT